MSFFEFSWADSNIDSIHIEYDCAKLLIWNSVLQKNLVVECLGLAGITNLCIWDDTIIMSANIYSVDKVENDFLQALYNAYDKDFDYGGRSLNAGLFELKIELVNHISFSVYCQHIEVHENIK